VSEKKHPRIAVIRQRFNATGGAERFIVSMMGALGTAADFTIVTRQWQGADNAATVILDPWHVGSFWRDWSFNRAVKKYLASHTFDIVQSHERLDGCDLFRAGDGVHATWLALRERYEGSAAALAIAVNPQHRRVVAEEARMFRNPRLRAVVCNSTMVAQDIVRQFAVPTDKVRVIYNAVDGDRFNPDRRLRTQASQRAALAIPANAIVLLHVGSGFARKGVQTLLAALVRLPAHVFAVIAGHDKAMPAYQKMAEEWGIAPRVRWLGAVAAPEDCYAIADALVLATLYDPFPNVTLEAMASGLPIVTTTTCGAAELVDPTIGSVIEPRNPAALAGAIGQLLDAGIGAREAMGAAARLRVASLTADRMRGEYQRLYQSILADKGA
jgi:UDP-glucose:(heptosyl)LPS alpha-1,3-glucosyltransferase